MTKKANDYFGNATGEAENHNPFRGFYQQLYFEVFDNAVESIKQWFNQNDFKKYLKQLNLRAIEENNYQEELKITKDLYKDEFNC